MSYYYVNLGGVINIHVKKHNVIRLLPNPYVLLSSCLSYSKEQWVSLRKINWRRYLAYYRTCA